MSSPSTPRMEQNKRNNGKVDVHELLRFVFPDTFQHPLSTGRLYAFGLYGPLDEEGANLRAGQNGQRVVTPWELDTMCLQLEREDVLQVYTPEDRPLFVLTEEQKQEIIAQADSHLKTAKGRGYRRQITHNEVVELLSGLARDEAGLVSFHEVQKVILGFRRDQIARFRVIFPDLVPSRRSIHHRRPSYDKQDAAPAHSSSNNDDRGDSNGKVSRKKVGHARHEEESTSEAITKKKEPTVVRQHKRNIDTTRGSDTGRRRARGGGGGGGGGGTAATSADHSRPKFSADVAPPEMFSKDAGFTPAGLVKHTNKLLHARACQIGSIADSSHPALTQNVRLVRDDSRGGKWDDCACLRGSNVCVDVRFIRNRAARKGQ